MFFQPASYLPLSLSQFFIPNMLYTTLDIHSFEAYAKYMADKPKVDSVMIAYDDPINRCRKYYTLVAVDHYDYLTMTRIEFKHYLLKQLKEANAKIEEMIMKDYDEPKSS